MPVITLTKRFLDTVRPPAIGQVEYFDTKVRGLALRVGKSGRRSWSVHYRVRGARTKRRAPLNPQLDLDGARVKARAVLSDAWDGADAAAAEQLARKAPTIEDLIAEFEKRHLPNLRTGAEYSRNLRAEILGEVRPRKGKGAPAPLARAISWKGRKAADIRRRDVIALLDSIVDRGAPLSANRTLAQLRKLFNFGIGRDLVEANPCTAVPRPGKEARRDRVLNDSEIRAMWSALDQAALDPQTRVALRIVLLTAQRPGEVANMAWAELDRGAGWWTIPGAKAKNGLAHRVPLTGPVLDLLAGLPKRNPVWVFDSPTVGKDGKPRPLSRGALSHAMAKVRALLPDVPRFTVHDLRRTAASHMTGDGVSRVVVAKVLNHVETGVTAIYDRASYDREKRAALELWASRVREIITLLGCER